MQASNLKDLYIAALKKMHDGEKQIVNALPSMAQNATNSDLQSAFQDHRGESETHQSRLEEILQDLGEEALSNENENEVVTALVQQGESVIQSGADEHVRDAALIAAAQQVEHFEIASYGSLVNFAEALDRTEDVDRLKETLNEEKSANDKLNDIAKSDVNPKALKS
ncbi:ferritin-like domain-containing protein [Salinisphaera sp.]|uniref:YciE/YciF ferroxidase family protein n=1 Tax=Salinisphaera sp. TaxID=1914330 RepID=UPI002D7980E5|nr:DUF892 family protein [Salinisphaera sp.]HET7313990.1 DUF892 family protein [Salinisphaera sp.]